MGAIWSSCSPDFGARAVRDRFAQIEPTVLLAVDGYLYNGKRFDIRPDVASAAASMPTLRATVVVPYVDDSRGDARPDTVAWDDLLEQQPAPS